MDAYSFRESNIKKTIFIFVIFLALVIGLGFFFSYLFESRIILYFAVFYSILASFLSYYRSDKIALRISKAKPADKNEYKELYNIVENLCISQGLEIPKIYIIEDNSPNAFATGRNPKHSAIAVTTGLLEILDRSEIEGVIAHELSHIKNYDILVASVVVVLVGVIYMLSDIFLRSTYLRNRDNDRGNSGSLPLLIGAVLALLAPLAAALMQLAISRKREYLADTTGALITRYPEGLASALEKISRAPKMRVTNNSTAHLFFSDPAKRDVLSKRKFLIARLFDTHPPIEDRIKRLREMA